jgi:hypothetical protein
MSEESRAPLTIKNVPTNLLRLVFQVEDTPLNRVALEECVKKIQEVAFPVHPVHSILKLETIQLALAMRIEKKKKL